MPEGVIFLVVVLGLITLAMGRSIFSKNNRVSPCNRM